MNSIIKIIVLLIHSSSSFILPSIFTDRRIIMSNTIFSSRNFLFKNKVEKNYTVDKYAHWALNGLIPPPIEKSISKEELINEINKKNILALQISVQHDNVIVTTKKNHRLSCKIKDIEFNNFINEFRDENKQIPFQVIPIDTNKQEIRNFAEFFFGAYIIRFLIYELPNNIRILNNCNNTMSTRQKIIFLLQNQNNLNFYYNSSK